MIRRQLTLWRLIVLGSSAVLAINAPWEDRSAQAHGAIATYEKHTQIRVEAQFDGGLPMADAQFIIYSPDDRQTPWLTGMTDEQGQFVFTPDLAQPGDWEVMVRQAGHGHKLVIPLDSEVTRGPGPRSQVQTLLMGAVALWGFIGTALFFMGRSRRPRGEILMSSEASYTQETLSGRGIEGRG